jgi:hypothetical protein
LIDLIPVKRYLLDRIFSFNSGEELAALLCGAVSYKSADIRHNKEVMVSLRKTTTNTGDTDSDPYGSKTAGQPKLSAFFSL